MKLNIAFGLANIILFSALLVFYIERTDGIQTRLDELEDNILNSCNIIMHQED